MMMLVLLALSPKPARAVTTPISSLEWATQILEEVLTIPEGGIPRSVLDKALAVAVFPNATRSELSGGGALAEGIIIAKNEDGTWTNPAFVIMREPVSGTDLASLTNDALLVFRNRESIRVLEKAPLTLGLDAVAESGPLANTQKPGDTGQAQIYSYTRDKKSLVGLTLTGVVLQFDRGSNEDLYGRKGITLGEIFTGKQLVVPVAAGKLKCTLAMHTDIRQMCG